MFKNPIVKNVLSALAIAIFGFILLNLTFLFDAIYQNILRGIVGIFITLGPETNIRWLPPLFHGSFVVVIGLISWLVFRSKLKAIYKAVYMCVPAAVILVTTGIFLYQWSIVPYLVGGLLTLGTLYYFYRTKQPWQYWYAVILTSFVLAIFTFFGGEI